MSDLERRLADLEHRQQQADDEEGCGCLLTLGALLVTVVIILILGRCG
jgi:hypothetical protein